MKVWTESVGRQIERRESRNVRDSPVPLFFQYEDHHADWLTNAAGFSHSHQHGFGLLNAWRLVNAAKVNKAWASRAPCRERLREGYLMPKHCLAFYRHLTTVALILADNHLISEKQKFPSC